MTGYINLYRQLLESPIAKKSQYAWLWCTLLLLANYKEHKLLWNNKTITIKKGQILTSRDKLATLTGIKSSTIERILKYLENEQQIEQQKTTKFRIITILNWERYQNPMARKFEQVDNKTDNKWTTNGQQVDTYNKDNKDNKDNKKKRRGQFVPPTIEQIRARCKEKGYTIKPEEFYYHYESNGWMVGKNKMKSWQATLSKWAYKDNAFEKKPNWWVKGKYD